MGSRPTGQDTGFWSQESGFESLLPSCVPSGGCEHMFVPRVHRGRARERRSCAVVGEVLRTSACAPPAATAGCSRSRPRCGIPTSTSTRHVAWRREPIALDEVAGPGVDLPARQLKRRLYDEGLKQRACELCGQGEEWRGRRMSLILDHINGVADDNRLETSGSSARTAPRRSTRTAAQPIRRRRADCPRCGAFGQALTAHARARADAVGAHAAGRRSGRVAAPPRSEALRLVSRRTQVRRQRQRGAQVDARRTSAGARRREAGLRVSSGRRRLVRRPPRLALFMRIRTLAAAVAALLVPAAPAFAGDPTMPLSQVQAGMRCTGTR